MPTFNASNAECLVFTYKDGLLSAVAHDLKIKVTDFTIEVNEETDDVRGEFIAGSLRVVNAMADGNETTALGEKDKKTIEDTIINDVLHAARHPRITFESQAYREKGDGYQIKGNLELHGSKREVVVEVQPKDGRLVVETTLHQPDFGMKPYSAMFGTLKIKPDVKIRLSVPEW